MTTIEQLKNDARRIEAFVRECGGTIVYSKALEFASQRAGFKNFRVAKTVLEQQAKAERPVLLATQVRDWTVAEGESTTDAEREALYDFRFERVSKDQYGLLLVQAGAPESGVGRPLLDCFIEVNHGVPTIHMSNDPCGDTLLSVFATKDGVIVRGGCCHPASSVDDESTLGQLAKQTCDRDNPAAFYERRNYD